MDVPALQVDGVTKKYEKHLAVDNISFEVERGVLFGMLGPNGAGKTSTIRMITGITLPDSGKIFLNGKRVDGSLTPGIGYLPEERGLYRKMTVGEHLMYLIRLRGFSSSEGRKLVDDWVERFDIGSWWKKKIEELSKGMQQKIQFIAAVMHNPDLMILDEPFSGLDPVNSNLIREEIRRLSSLGKGVILSTHRMEQVEELCEKIVLINRGRIVLTGNLDEIKESYWKNEFLLDFENSDQQPDWNGLEEVERDHKGRWKIRLKEGQSTGEMLNGLINSGREIIHFEKSLPSLNDIFIQVTGEDLIREE
ncbi:MAG: ATP-binding cassette domain-containing protein [Saprospirales bacterium]|nr:MAG: ATP-binding cassette domain-containing protein [Saprospirales bacterium]